MTIRAIYGETGLQFADADWQDLHAWLAQRKPSDKYAVTIEPWDAHRSRHQQNLLHELIGRYARAQREPLAVCKMRMKVDLGYYIPASVLLSGEVDFPTWRGQWVDLHSVYPLMHEERTIAFVRSESSYTKSMEKIFIDYAIELCEGSGVNIDDILQEVSR